MNDRILRKAILKTEEEYANDETFETAQDDAVQVASEFAPPLSSEQKEILNRLTSSAEKARYQVDAKANAILNWLNTYLKTDGRWNNKRVILLTEYRATHAWLHQILTANGFGGKQLLSLHGSMKLDERETVKASFQAHPNISPVRILLATDAASEGIDLQNHCNYLIHIEIPWNPNVMEQRNGRIDRHGQKEDAVFIWHPVGKGFSADLTGDIKPGNITGTNEYLMRAVLKIDTIREDLGSVGPVIASQIEEAMLGQRISLDTISAGREKKAAKAKNFIAAEKRLQERIAKLHERLLEAKRRFHLAPDHIARAVKIALELAEKPPLQTVSTIQDKSIFNVPILSGSWGKATVGLEHPHTGVRRPITFDHNLAKGKDDLVLAHLNHRLVQMCLRLLREEIWKLDDVKRLHRVAVHYVPDSELTSL